MAAEPSQATRHFLAALHRRAVVIRIAERIAVALLPAAAIAIVVTLIAWWRDHSSLQITTTALLGGVLVGLTWGILRRPSRLDAAIPADLQLQLDDLLGTAATLTV